MGTGETLRIGDVVNRTGLTERMIRHYEHKGLIAPQRTAAGQRVFDANDVTRLAIIQLLKRAGMSLAAIGAWLSGGVDAKNLIRAELELLRDDARRTSAASAALESLQSELTDGAHLDLAPLTRIFETTADAPSEDTAAAFFQRHFAPSNAARWRLVHNPFMKDQQATASVLLPAFIGMLRFWPMLAAAVQDSPASAPLILAVGMSIHWPVIGWSYARTGVYSAHAIVRAVVVTWIWFRYPEQRLTWLPLSAAVVYLVAVVVILLDSGKVRRAHDGWQR